MATMLGKYTLTLIPYTSLSNWGEHEGPPVVTLDDERNNTIVEINSGIAGVSAQDLQTLMVFARRIAFNADEKIDELLQELKRGDDEQR